jgi:hypothetical protein
MFLAPHDLTESLDMEGTFEVKEEVENTSVYSQQEFGTTAQRWVESLGPKARLS